MFEGGKDDKRTAAEAKDEKKEMLIRLLRLMTPSRLISTM